MKFIERKHQTWIFCGFIINIYGHLRIHEFATNDAINSTYNYSHSLIALQWTLNFIDPLKKVGIQQILMKSKYLIKVRTVQK